MVLQPSSPNKTRYLHLPFLSLRRPAVSQEEIVLNLFIPCVYWIAGSSGNRVTIFLSSHEKWVYKWWFPDIWSSDDCNPWKFGHNPGSSAGSFLLPHRVVHRCHYRSWNLKENNPRSQVVEFIGIHESFTIINLVTTSNTFLSTLLSIAATDIIQFMNTTSNIYHKYYEIRFFNGK